MKIKLLLLALLLAGSNLIAQWVPCNNGIDGGMINCLYADGDKIYAGTNGGLYRSTDNGKNWTNLTGMNKNNYINAVVAQNNTIFVNCYNFGIYSSSDDGTTWEEGFIKNIMNTTMLLNNDTVYIGNADGVYVVPLKNQGSWSINSLPEVFSLCSYNNKLFAGTKIGVYSSVDGGTNWVSSGLDMIKINCVYSFGNKIFAGSDSGLYQSDANNISWQSTGTNHAKIISITATESSVYVLTDSVGYNAIYYSSDNAQTWSRANIGDRIYNLSSIVTSGNTIITGSLTQGILTSDDNGLSWTKNNTGIKQANVNTIFVDGNNLLAGTNEEGLYMSTDNGDSWTLKNNGMDRGFVTSVIKKDNLLFAASDGKVYMSSDNSDSWTKQYNTDSVNITNLDTDGSLIFGVNNNYGHPLYISSDNGQSWQKNTVDGSSIIVVCSDGDRLFTGTKESVYMSTDKGSSWEQIMKYNGKYSACRFIKRIDNLLYTSFATIGLFYSTNDGTSWSKYDSLNDSDIADIIGKGSNYYAGGSWGLYVSTNSGISWTDKFSSITYPNIYTLAIKDNYIYAGTSGYGIYRADLKSITAITDSPNPNDEISIAYYKNQETFHLMLKDVQSNPISFSVYDLNGHQLMSKSLPSGICEENIDVSCLTTGVYFVVVGDRVRKFIKE